MNQLLGQNQYNLLFYFLVNIIQLNGNYIPESDITVDNFKVNDYALGKFRANIIGNSTLTNYDVNVSLKEAIILKLFH